MSKLGTMTLTGASGVKYKFVIYSTDTNWNNNVRCVYYISRRQQKPGGGFTHTNIYIGETEDLKERLGSHHKQGCFDQHNYNGVSILQESNSNQRFGIEADLVAALKPPCNG